MAYERVQDNILQTTSLAEKPEVFLPSDKERDFIMQVYGDFVDDYSIKSNGWQVLNNRTLEQFWYDSNYDYNQIVEQDDNNPVTQYSSGISRDKANTFITNLTNSILYPSVTAVNTAQTIDNTISYISRPLLRWQYINDGRPAESGKIKNVRYTHKQVVEGTVHILDTVGPDGKLTSTIIPNEEVFIPNFFEPNIQLQSHFMQVQQWASFGQVQAEFGDLDNFKYVTPGSLGWLNETSAFKEKYKGIISNNQTTVIRCWYPVRKKEVDRLKKIGRLPKFVKQARYFNVIIGGVNMFPWDNLMPYYHGNLPVTKSVLESFSPAEFYWGNSAPNKAGQDKHFLDGWKTLIRYKGKLSAIPATLNFTGQHIEQDIYVPGVMTDLPGNIDPNRIVAVPGSDKGVTNSDSMILNDTVADIERETNSAQTSGEQSKDIQTARQSMIIEQNAAKMLMAMAKQVAFREEARAFPILKATFQFLPRQTIKKISIPDQTFKDGTNGSLEVIFHKIGKMTKEERNQASLEILKMENESKKDGMVKKMAMVDPEYIQDIDLYCEAIADELTTANSAFREAKAEFKWETYKADPDVFNKVMAARQLVRELGDDEQQMIVQTSQQQPQGQPGQLGQPGQPQGPGQGQPPPQAQSPQGPTNPLQGQFSRQLQTLGTQQIT